MVAAVEFATDTDLARGLQQLIVRLHERTNLRVPLRMYVAGGMAIHLYTVARVTTDVDAEFSRKIIFPPDLLVEIDGGAMLYLDTNYSSSFALLHEDYLSDALKAPFGTDLIEVFVLKPLDLIVSKIARFHETDRSDIATLIATFGVTADSIEERAEHALLGYVGNIDYLRMNLREVVDMARSLTRDA